MREHRLSQHDVLGISLNDVLKGKGGRKLLLAQLLPQWVDGYEEAEKVDDHCQVRSPKDWSDALPVDAEMVDFYRNILASLHATRLLVQANLPEEVMYADPFRVMPVSPNQFMQRAAMVSAQPHLWSRARETIERWKYDLGETLEVAAKERTLAITREAEIITVLACRQLILAPSGDIGSKTWRFLKSASTGEMNTAHQLAQVTQTATKHDHDEIKKNEWMKKKIVDYKGALIDDRRLLALVTAAVDLDEAMPKGLVTDLKRAFFYPPELKKLVDQPPFFGRANANSGVIKPKDLKALKGTLQTTVAQADLPKVRAAYMEAQTSDPALFDQYLSLFSSAPRLFEQDQIDQD